MPRVTKAVKYTPARDAAADKRARVKPGSARDTRLDRKRGIPPGKDKG